MLPLEAAPALYSIAGRIGRDVGAKPVALITLNAGFNASYAQLGLRRRRVLSIGLSLWNVLTDQQRVAIIAHELAHQVNGDLSETVVVGTALRSLSEWHQALRLPRWTPGGGSMFAFIETLAQVGTRAVFGILRFGVGRLFDVESGLLFRSGQRAEYYADRLAAQVSSTLAMVECLDTCHLDRACSLALRYAAQRQEPDIWAAQRRFFDDFNPKEWERLRRLDARRGSAVDATHPPTNLRIDLLRSGTQYEARVEMSREESLAVAHEMASAFALVGDNVAARFAE